MGKSDTGTMTIGALSKRTGLSIKRLREYEDLGLIRSLGRSEGNYRLFDETAVWCVEVIAQARSLGLTVREILDLHDLHARRPEEPLGPHLAQRLDGALVQIQARVAALEATRRRILEFRARYAPALGGGRRHGPFESPRHREHPAAPAQVHHFARPETA